MNAIVEDDRHMRHALRLATRSLGRVAPNPAVGCVIISKGGVVVGRGWTDVGGRPHAESRALEQAGNRAKSSTVYVTLERLERKGYLNSKLGSPTPERGGKSKRMFTIRATGIKALQKSLGDVTEMCAGLRDLNFAR